MTVNLLNEIEKSCDGYRVSTTRSDIPLDSEAVQVDVVLLDDWMTKDVSPDYELNSVDSSSDVVLDDDAKMKILGM